MVSPGKSRSKTADAIFTTFPQKTYVIHIFIHRATDEVDLKLRILSIACIAALAAAAYSLSPARAQNMFAGLAIDGVRCDVSEGAVEHIHAHLQIFNRARPSTVPGQVGIPQGAGCLYWVHTHTDDGIIHIEAPVARTFTLGQFFDIWDMTLSRTEAAGVHASKGHSLTVTVNGKRWTGDPRAIPLRDREEIVIQNGPPFTSGRRADWSKL
jgi:hypothetical protein